MPNDPLAAVRASPGTDLIQQDVAWEGNEAKFKNAFKGLSSSREDLMGNSKS